MRNPGITILSHLQAERPLPAGIVIAPGFRIRFCQSDVNLKVAGFNLKSLL